MQRPETQADSDAVTGPGSQNSMLLLSDRMDLLSATDGRTGVMRVIKKIKMRWDM
jgi:hypothetical protein